MFARVFAHLYGFLMSPQSLTRSADSLSSRFCRRYNIRMKIHRRKLSWPRLFLWSHAIGVAGFYTGLWFRTRPHGLKPVPACDSVFSRPHSAPLVSIILPARDEERNIHRCVTSLLDQDYPHYELIVVDDDSTDATPCILDEIAQTHPHADRLWVLRLRELRSGWAGKPHALHSGIQEAHGDWLLFTDADTWHAPDTLRLTLASACEEHVDMLSLGTLQELPGFWEKVVMPMIYLGIIMQYPVNKINDPHSSIALANGQYILIRRSVYEQSGGYARPDMRATLLDDRDLARLVKRQGFRLRLFDGRDLVHVRMYQGLRETWKGWRKNIFLGSRGGLAFTILQVLSLPLVTVLPFLLPALLLFGRVNDNKTRKARSTQAALASLLELGPLCVYRMWINKEMRVPWYYTFTHPLAGLLCAGIMAQSTWRVVRRKGVDWRGRQYYDSSTT